MDILKLIRRRQWAKIWRLKDRLPMDSHYQTALAMDPELAKQLIELDKDDDEDEIVPRPTPLGYTREVHMLAGIIDGIQALQATLLAVNGNDPPRMTPFPRPWTAKDELKEDIWVDRMSNFADEIFGTTIDEDEYI